MDGCELALDMSASAAALANDVLSSFDQASLIADIDPEEHVDRQLRRLTTQVSA